MDKSNIFTINQPDHTSALPLIFDSPHSGRIYPDDFGYDCDPALLIRAEDNYVDALFDHVPAYGGTLLCAQFPRTYIDVNRAPDDIDTELLAENWPDPLNPSARSLAGIGLIRRLIRPGVPLYSRRLSVKEIEQRLEIYYKNYHSALRNLLDQSYRQYGQVWHINCHSMPSGPAAPPLPHGRALSLPGQPDFVLGDRDGTSCALEFTHALRDALRDMGYRVAINRPYKGVELVRRYAAPSLGRHAIQIEINKALYWDEDKGEKLKNYSALKEDLEKLSLFLQAYINNNLVNLAAD